MTQAQLSLHNLQTQLEQPSSDLTTQSLILFLEPMDNSDNAEQVEEQPEHTTSSKIYTPPDNSNETPPPSEKRYRITKDPVFLSSLICPPKIPTNPSRSTNPDDHLIPLLSHDNFTFKAQINSLYMHPTVYTFRLYDKKQNFLHPLFRT